MDPITIVLAGDSDEAQRLGARDFLNTSQPTILTWMTVDNSIEVRLTVTPLPFPGVPCQQIWKYDIGDSASTPRNTLESSDFLSNVRTEAQNVADRLYQPAHWSFEAQPIAIYDANAGTSRSERPSRIRRAPYAGPQTTSPLQRQELDTLQACDRPSSVGTRPAPACDEQKKLARKLRISTSEQLSSRDAERMYILILDGATRLNSKERAEQQHDLRLAAFDHIPAKDLWQLAEGLDAWARKEEVQSLLADLLCSAALKAASQKYRNSAGSGNEMKEASSPHQYGFRLSLPHCTLSPLV